MWLTLVVIGAAHLILALPFAVQILLHELRRSRSRDGGGGDDRGRGATGGFSGRSSCRFSSRESSPSLMFAFLISFDEPVVSLFMSRHDVVTLPVRIFTYMRFRPDPTIAAISTVMSLLALLAIIVVDRQIGLDRILGLRR